MIKQMIFNNYQKHRNLINNFFWRGLQTVSKQGILFAILLLCAKILPPYDFGVYNYVLAIIFFLVIFGDFGISTATSKFVAQYHVIDQKKTKFVLFNAALIIIVLATIISLIILLIGKIIFPEQYLFIVYSLPLILFAPLTSLYDGFYRGLQQFKKLAIISLITGLISLVITYFVISRYGLIGAIVSQNMFYFILAASLGLGCRRIAFKIDKEVISSIIKYSMIIGLASIGYYLYYKADILVLGHFNYVEEIGYYELLNRFFMLLILPFVILGQVIAPTITRYYSVGKYQLVRSKLRKYSYLSLGIGILATLVLYLTLPKIIEVFLNNYFNSSTILMLKFLLPLLPLKFMSTITNHGFITPTGQAKILAILNIIFGSLNVLLDIIFIYYFGFMGVVYATIIIHSSTIILMVFIYNKFYLK